MTKSKINRVLDQEASPQEYTITKPLKLETVNEGTNEDDVLVRGTDNTVKYVPQSSLGGGGSQNLKQTLDNGTFASFVNDGYSATVHVGTDANGDGSRLFSYFAQHNTGQSEGIDTSLDTGIRFASQLSNEQGVLRFKNGKFNLSESDLVNSTCTNITLKKPIARDGTVELKFPAKNNAGEYILATLDDIPESSQNLQQTLANGTSATYDTGDYATSIHIGADIGDGNRIFSYNSRSTIGQNEGIDISLDSGTVVSSQKSNNQSYIKSRNGKINLTESNLGISASTNVTFTAPVATDGTVELKFPAKNNAGEYILATLDDIPESSQNLQQTLANGGVATLGTPSTNEALYKMNNSEFLTDISFDNGVDPITYSFLRATKNLIALGQGSEEGNGKEVLLRIASGNFELTNSLNGESFTEVTFQDNIPNRITRLKFPVYPISGEYTLATREDLAIDNSTTSALNLSTLNSTYPSAVNGFRVNCMLITSGAIIYQKTASGWAQYAVTSVAP